MININAVDGVIPKLVTGEISFSLHYTQLKTLTALFLIIEHNSSKAVQLHRLHLFKNSALKLITCTDVYFSVYHDEFRKQSILKYYSIANSYIDQAVWLIKHYYSAPVQIFQLLFHYTFDYTFEEYLKTVKNSVYQMVSILSQ